VKTWNETHRWRHAGRDLDRAPVRRGRREEDLDVRRRPDGAIAKGFTNETGEWKVVNSDSGKALAQTAKSGDAVFQRHPGRGYERQGCRRLGSGSRPSLVPTIKAGGLVWRAKDAKNYYIARYNHLEDNYRVYKVVDGNRTMFLSANITHDAAWHTLRVTMTGDHIECYYDGKKYLDVHDSTFPGAGKIGLWSKADAQSQFDDLTLAGK